MQSLKWKGGEVVIALDTLDEQMISAMVCGPFAVHQHPSGIGYGYNVTLIATKRAIKQHLPTLKTAKKFVALLLKAESREFFEGDWAPRFIVALEKADAVIR